MILLREVFSLLAGGEFAHINLSKDKNGAILETEYNRIINALNLGMVEIYKRFKLLETEIVLHVNPDTKTYYIREEYVAPSSGVTSTRYIERPFQYDGHLNLIEISSVFDDSGYEFKLNNRYQIPQVKLTSEDTLVITGLESDQKFYVTYQSYPSPIALNDDFNINIYQLPISRNIVEALLYYTAGRIFKSMGANNSTANADKGESYNHKYELSCQKLNMFGLHIEDNDKEDTFTRDGWV